jgi:hypothetical protein
MRANDDDGAMPTIVGAPSLDFPPPHAAIAVAKVIAIVPYQSCRIAVAELIASPSLPECSAPKASRR